MANRAQGPAQPGREPEGGLILFCHGSRDPRWGEPFERLAARVRAEAPALAVSLAFLEAIAPDLQAAADAMIARGVGSIHVVPIFLGQGGHIRSDLPVLIEALRKRHPSVAISCAGAAGEDDTVIASLADYCLRELRR